MSTNSAARAVYRTDLLVNVAWAVMTSVLLGFVFVLARRAGGDTWLISYSVSVNYLPGMLAGILPPLSRRVPLGTLVPVLRLISSLALLLCVAFPSLDMLKWSLLVTLVTFGLSDIGYAALFNTLYPVREHARTLGQFYTWRTLASAGIVYLFGYLADGLDTPNCIRLLGGMGVFGLIAAGAGWRFANVREAAPTTTAPTPDTVPSTPPLANREFLWYLVSLTVFGCGAIIYCVVWPLLQVDAFHLSNGQVGLMAALMQLAQMGTYLYFSRYGAVRPSNRLLAWPYALQAAVMLVSLGLLLLKPVGIAPFWPLLLAGIIGQIGGGLQGILLILVVNAMAGNASALAYQSVQNIVIGVRGTLLPLLVALVFPRFLDIITTTAIAAVLFLLGGALALLSSPRRPTQSAPPRMAEEVQ